MYDNVCKFLAETFSNDFAQWLLGEAITLTQLSPRELSLEPIRADALILLESEGVVLHIEFQTEPQPEIPFRMADYRLRVYRRYPNKREKEVITRLLRQEIMRESVIYQDIRAEGKIEGKREEGVSLVLRLLRKRIGEVSVDLEKRIAGLSVEQLEDLGEAVLDFQTPADLLSWFDND